MTHLVRQAGALGKIPRRSHDLEVDTPSQAVRATRV